MTAKALADTHAAAFATSRPWSEAEFTSLLGQKGVSVIGDLQSFILIRAIADEIEILTLATHPAAQRQGKAAKNLNALMDKAIELEASTIFLEVAADNTPAIQLYANAGFAKIATRSAYYARTNGQAADALILQKKLDPA